MFEDPKAPPLGTILVFNEVQCDPLPSSFFRDLLSSNVCLVPFVMMKNKDNCYNSNLYSSTGGTSYILTICSLHTMKTGLDIETFSSFKFNS